MRKLAQEEMRRSLLTNLRNCARLLNMSDLLTTAQAAEIVGKSVPTVNRWAAEGVLTPAHKLPGRTGAYLFERAEVERVRDEYAGSGETVA